MRVIFLYIMKLSGKINYMRNMERSEWKHLHLLNIIKNDNSSVLKAPGKSMQLIIKLLMTAKWQNIAKLTSFVKVDKRSAMVFRLSIDSSMQAQAPTQGCKAPFE